MCESRFKITGKTFALFIFGLIYLTACTLLGLDRTPTPTAIQDPDLIDRSWFTGDPCLPPCWYGMEVGKTTFEEASQQIRTLTFIDPDSIWEGEADYIFFPPPTPVVPGKQINLYCKQPESKICARMWFVNNVLMDIFIFPNYRVTFLEVVQQLGEPDFLTVDPTQRIGCKITLRWTENQMSITHSEQHRDAKRRLCQLVRDSDYKIPKDLYVWSVFISMIDRDVDFSHWMNSPWQGFIDP